MPLKCVLVLCVVQLLEMFGAGTACVVSPVAGVLYGGQMLDIPTMDNPAITNRCMQELLDIQVHTYHAF